MSTRRTVLSTSIAGLLGGAIILGSTPVGASAASAGTVVRAGSVQPAAVSPAVGVEHLGDFADRECGAIWKRLPAELKAELRAARALPAWEERRRALRAIARDIRAGEYGEAVRALAEKRRELRQELRKRLPAELRADLKAVRQLPRGERRAALAEVWRDALAGEYGPRVQQLAEHRQERREECRGGAQAGSERGSFEA